MNGHWLDQPEHPCALPEAHPVYVGLRFQCDDCQTVWTMLKTANGGELVWVR